ncbi:cell cycle checkpoint protein [Scheffersomyces amazonensis]|uniref:cell cycle checkpoint protein n=1 Tax=Scheffersomyces amazonensis TaxID=1078765 RepID=UPI00315DF317
MSVGSSAPVSATQRISKSDLTQFLDDIEKNINTDDNADFKKLILYLFQFTNDKLWNLSSEDSHELVPRLLDTIELVLSKRLHLLNLLLEYDDYCSIYVPTEEEESSESSESSYLLYDWSILFAIDHIPSYHNNITLLNHIKSFIIHIINLVTTKLHNFKYVKQLRSKLLTILDTNISILLNSIGNDGIEMNKTLIQTVHMFSILNDYDLSIKLSLNLISYQLKFESYSRKIWFILNEIYPYPSNEDTLQLVDNLKSIVVMNLTDNLVLYDSTTWNQISMVLTWIIEYLRTDLDKSMNVTKSAAYTFLKIFALCIDKDIVENFINCNNLRSLLAKLDDKSFTKSLPGLIVKALHIIRFRYGTFIDDTIVVNEYRTSDSNQFIIKPFVDMELESLRLKLLNLPNGQSQEEYLSQWIHYVKHLIQHESQIFDEDYTLYTMITALGNFSCLLSKDFNFRINECSRCGSGSKYKNYYDNIDVKRRVFYTSPEIVGLYEIIISDFLIGKKRHVLDTNPLICTNLLLTIYKLFASYNPQTSTVHDERVFNFIIYCLTNNHNRDVRLLAGRILPLYLIQDKTVNTDSIFKRIFQIITNIDFTSENRQHFAESTIRALSELAVISEGERLCVIFIKLIDYFGENNEQHANYGYSAILYISSAKVMPPYKLLFPFLPSISEVIIKKPRMLSRVTEVLGVTIKFFLTRTREYTTPRLLEYYKHDFIQDIAQACDLTKLELIHKNLSRIIAYYLVRDAHIDEQYIINVLSTVYPNYQLLTLADIIRKSGELTWFILLQIQVDEGNNIVNNDRILNALKYTAKVTIKQKDKPINVQGKYVEFLLDENVLELVQRFSENMHHIKGTKPYLEKISSLRAIEFLINTNINAATTALGQISTCLQASLETAEFQYHTLRNFHALILKLPRNHLITIVDIIISSIYQKYEEFDKNSKDLAVRVLKDIFTEITTKRSSRLVLYLLSIPFLKHIEVRDIISGGFNKNIKQISRLVIFQEFTRRLNTSNEYVVKQALFDLTNYCQQYQINCQTEYFKDPMLEVSIGDLIRVVLDTAAKFKTTNESISTGCAKAMSVIGSLDSNKFKFKTIKKQIVIIQDFKDYKENSEFLVDFIENRVLKIFWASSDPVKQLFSAYAMQNFLKILKLNHDILTPNSQDHLLLVWDRFSEIAKSTLTPLLSSKYVAPTVKYEPIEFPLFKLGMKYEAWLVEFTSDLLKRPLVKPKSSKHAIFQTCARLIRDRDQDISLCNYLLKYVALSHIINGNELAINNIKQEFLNILHTDFTTSVTAISPERIESLKACFQAVFEVLDYLNEWVSTATHYSSTNYLENEDSIRIKANIKYIREFLSVIPMDLIAIKSAECDSYERTILYLEKCYREGKVDNLNLVTTLQSMYSNLNDYDSLNGVLKKFSTNNLGEKLKTFQYNENWNLAQESFQILGTVGDSQVENNTKLLKSFHEHGLHEEVLATLAEKSDARELSLIPLDWALVGLQSSVYSGDVKEIQKWFFVVNSIGKPQDVETLITYEFAKGVNFLFENKPSEFTSCMNHLYKIIGKNLVPTTSSNFSRNVTLMNQLHSIYDLSLIIKSDPDNDNEVILKQRLANIDQGFDTQLQVLSLHNIGNQMKLDNGKIAEVLLFSSSLARKNNRLDISTRSILKAMALNCKDANIEYAKLLWAQGKQTEAIKSLSEIRHDIDGDTGNDEKRAEVQLYYAKWLDESNHLSSQAIIDEYNKAIQLNSASERAYYDLGSYFNKVFESSNDQTGYYEQQTVRNYLKSLSLGSRYIFEALPKVITMWLDLAQRSNKNREAERRINLMVDDLNKGIISIPACVWYTAITQLLSRIVHEHIPSYEHISTILYVIVRQYPQHSLWYVLSHSNSRDSIRRERISDILSRVKAATDNIDTLNIDKAKELFNSLNKIANVKVPKNTKQKRLSLKRNFNVLNLDDPFEALVIPVRSNLDIRLPSVYTLRISPFPRSATVTFDGVDDVVNLFFSLQMPRQITIRGSDGKAYRLMVKRDDTRKDAKVGEFTTMINRLLSSSNEARKRDLNIPNYAVIPLAEDSGVIEFVPDVQTLKGITTDQRKRMGQSLSERKVFIRLEEAQKPVRNNGHTNDNMSNLISVFNTIMNDHPPVLHHWFIDQFSDPSAWYLARTNLTRSLAVMSIVGYIIGLGDRHCENILIFKKSGSILHIDFDCLFEKGTTLPTPEIVPFRLTQNLIDAMGICGIEGSFRITCEVAGSLLRDNEAPLMNILETLLYDPLLDWKTQKPEAHLSKVRRKLRGLVSEKEGLPMHISGQVDVLIQEATSVERLAQMYGGWAPYV